MRLTVLSKGENERTRKRKGEQTKKEKEERCEGGETAGIIMHLFLRIAAFARLVVFSPSISLSLSQTHQCVCYALWLLNICRVALRYVSFPGLSLICNESIASFSSLLSKSAGKLFIAYSKKKSPHVLLLSSSSSLHLNSVRIRVCWLCVCVHSRVFSPFVSSEAPSHGDAGELVSQSDRARARTLLSI